MHIYCIFSLSCQHCLSDLSLAAQTNSCHGVIQFGNKLPIHESTDAIYIQIQQQEPKSNTNHWTSKTPTAAEIPWIFYQEWKTHNDIIMLSGTCHLDQTRQTQPAYNPSTYRHMWSEEAMTWSYLSLSAASRQWWKALCKERVKGVKPWLGSDSPPSGWPREWWECQGGLSELWRASPQRAASRRDQCGFRRTSACTCICVCAC